jgi:hypothetical protein
MHLDALGMSMLLVQLSKQRAGKLLTCSSPSPSIVSSGAGWSMVAAYDPKREDELVTPRRRRAPSSSSSSREHDKQEKSGTSLGAGIRAYMQLDLKARRGEYLSSNETTLNYDLSGGKPKHSRRRAMDAVIRIDMGRAPPALA